MMRFRSKSTGFCGAAAVLLAGAVLSGTLGFTAQAEDGPETKKDQAVVVNLKHWTDDLHAVFMAVKLAGALQARGADVTLFVNLEGARLADARQPGDLRWGTGKPFAGYYEAFIEAGGKVLVCPHCAMAAGMDAGSLRPGARIAAENDVVDALLAADKILDY